MSKMNSQQIHLKNQISSHSITPFKTESEERALQTNEENKETAQVEVTPNSTNTNNPSEQVISSPSSQPKSKSWIGWLVLSIILAAILGWIIYNIVNDVSKDVEAKKIYNIPSFLGGTFIVVTIGYLLGRITIKGVSLGTAGVFIIAILFGVMCCFIPSDTVIVGVFHLQNDSNNTVYYSSVLQNIGLVFFISSVGFIAGPKFFKDLSKNFKTYIVMGIVIILTGMVLALCFAFIPGIGSDFSAGVVSGALTSTPGYSAALEISTNAGFVTLGYAISYPFGVIGVVLFVQLIPKIMKADMEYERNLILQNIETTNTNTKNDDNTNNNKEELFTADSFGLTPMALAIFFGLLLGAIKIPLSGNGYNGACFSLGTTGGVLIMCLIFGHFGHMGKLSLEIPQSSAKVFRELGLLLFLIGAGISGGVQLVTQIKDNNSTAMKILWGFLSGIVITITPMIIGFIVAYKGMKLPLFNCLGGITGGMTSTPALGVIINTCKTEHVAGAYASTYPISLILIVLCSNLMVELL
jgi:putative transport protein